MCKPQQRLSYLSRYVAIVCSLLCIATTQTIANDRSDSNEQPVVVGYLPHYRLAEWSVEQIGPVTDIVFFADFLKPNGILKEPLINSANVAKLQGIKRATRCRIHICVGGGGQSQGFPLLADDVELRTKFIATLQDMCRRYGFDGVDYDWEHPKNAKELEAYADLLSETKQSFSRDGLLVSVAQAGWQDIGKSGYQAVDRVHLMSYDHEYPQATLEKAQQDVQRLLDWGCPPHKIVLGVPFYGRNKQGRARTYRELTGARDLASAGDAMDGYALNGKATIRSKVRFARTKNLGGVMIWEVGQDTRDPTTSLLAAIEEELDASVTAFRTLPNWPARKANAWYAKIDWPVGANFVPSTAINQLEMWQSQTWDPETIGRELGWAAKIGMNTMRVYLHDIPWGQDAEGFLERIDDYLTIADKHGIRTIFVIFDSVWHPHPRPGKQLDPIPGVHNSGWVQSPGITILDDPQRQDELKPYVQSVLRRFKDDKRVLAWDLFNEPENTNQSSYGPTSAHPDLDQATKEKRAIELTKKTFQWARQVNPTQPLTVGVWTGAGWSDNPHGMALLSLRNSDVISFHSYGGPEQTRKIVERLAKFGRPLICTEYMARSAGSTFKEILPIFKEHRVAAINWGLVAGRSNTIYPWSSWKKPFNSEPDPWFHDIFRKDGTPYRKSEVDFIMGSISKGPHPVP
jgi:hypothetical protein